MGGDPHLQDDLIYPDVPVSLSDPVSPHFFRTNSARTDSWVNFAGDG